MSGMKSSYVRLIFAVALANCVLSAKAEPKVEYGVDVSYPMHHDNVSTHYPWLSHNVDPSMETPSEYRDMPLQPLGNRQKFYDDFLRVCVNYFNTHHNQKGERCYASEKNRIEMSLRQPQSMQNFTKMGFEKIRAPEHIFKLIKEFWEANRMHPTKEEWGIGDMLTNHWQVPTDMVSVFRPDLQGGGEYLKGQIWEAARDIIQAWTGQQLQPSSIYGIRVYYGGAILAPHVDRLPLVSSAIINVDQDLDEPWPLEVIGHDGKAHNVTMQPGDMVLYESHSILHGRPFPMKGRFVANLFIHFEPIEITPQSTTGETTSTTKYASPNINGQTSLPKYILQDSPEAQRLKTKPLNHGISTVAHYAARANDLAALQRALDQQKDLIHARDENGWTPLNEAVRFGHVDVVKYLLELGADVNSRTRNHDGASVLWWAVNFAGEDHPVVELLKSRGAVLRKADEL